MFGFCPLASGSKGNAIFLGTKNTRVLIDAGISFTKLSQKLSEIDVDIHSIQAVLITHEHIDHIQALKRISEQLHIPILANAETAKGICQILKIKPRFKIFTTGEPFIYGDLEVHPFSISHDTMDPVAFTVKVDSLKIGFCTDLGYITSLVKKQLMDCDYLYLEANHEPSMVHACSRPSLYKQRVLGKQGHLSNTQCIELLLSISHEKLKHVHLAHLSEECNAQELALKKVVDALRQKNISADISIAHQNKISKCILF